MGYCRAVSGPVVEARENAPTRGRLSLGHTRERPVATASPAPRCRASEVLEHARWASRWEDQGGARVPASTALAVNGKHPHQPRCRRGCKPWLPAAI